MSDRTKKAILKLVLVIGLILLLAFFPGGLIISFFVPDQNTFDMIYSTIFFAMLTVGGVFIVLLPMLGGVKKKVAKAEKANLMFSSYYEFLSYLQMRLQVNKYELINSSSVLPDGEVMVYLRPRHSRTIDCFTIIRTLELSDELIDNANDVITDIIKTYYGSEIITGRINVISVFCVDRINHVFRKLVDGNLQQGLLNGRFLAGISFGGKKIYLARQIDGFAITKYRQLRKEFIDIMKLQDVNKPLCR